MPEKIKYTLKTADEKAIRTTRTGSKYDPIVDEFIQSGDKLAEVEVEGIKNTTMRTALQKLLDRREEKTVRAVTSAGIVYLERVDPTETAGE